MTNIIITDIEAAGEDVESLLAKLKSSTAATVVVQDVEAVGTSAWAYIKANGLTDLIAIAKSALLGAATGTSFTAIGAQVLAEGEAAGMTIAKGAEAIVIAGAQADLVAAGSLVSPTTGTQVAPVTVATTAAAS